MKIFTFLVVIQVLNSLIFHLHQGYLNVVEFWKSGKLKRLFKNQLGRVFFFTEKIHQNVNLKKVKCFLKCE